MDVVPEGAQVADEHRAGCSVPSSMLGKRKRRPQRETPTALRTPAAAPEHCHQCPTTPTAPGSQKPSVRGQWGGWTNKIRYLQKWGAFQCFYKRTLTPATPQANLQVLPSGSRQ